MIATSKTRVSAHTDPEVSQRIQEEIQQRAMFYANYPHRIPERLRQLDEEWDIERMLETGSATLSLAGLALGFLTGKKRYFLLPLAVQAFFLEHALEGWCPPLPVLRKLGFRTQYEIEQERHVLLNLANGEEETPMD
jgi:hypothetical protein